MQDSGINNLSVNPDFLKKSLLWPFPSYNKLVVVYLFQLNKEEALTALPHKAKEVTLEDAYQVLTELFTNATCLLIFPTFQTSPTGAATNKMLFQKKKKNRKCLSGIYRSRLRAVSLHISSNPPCDQKS